MENDDKREFRKWFGNVAKETDPDLIVVIARGALRLIDLESADAEIGRTPLVADCALPFLMAKQLRGRKVLLFDDSLIRGSTMDEIREYLLYRGAKVDCAAYVIDRQRFFGEGTSAGTADIKPSKYRDKLHVAHKYRLWPDEIRRHHRSIVRRLLSTSGHYNPEFPRFALSSQRFRAADIPYIAAEIQCAAVTGSFQDVSSSEAVANGIHRWVAHLPSTRLASLPLHPGVRQRPHAKLRATFVPSEGEIYLTPIYQLAIDDALTFDDVRYAQKEIQRHWRRAKRPYMTIPGDHSLKKLSSCVRRYHMRALFRLITSFVGIVEGTRLLHRIIANVDGYLELAKRDTLYDDLRAILGPENAEVLANLERQLSHTGVWSKHTDDLLSGETDPAENAPGQLMPSLLQKWDVEEALKPRQDDSIMEALGKVFLTLHEVTDPDDLPEEDQEAGRLRDGLSYNNISQIITQTTDVDYPREAVSLAIDECIDTGIAVPKILKRSGRWLRLFYSGENVPDISDHQFAWLIHYVYSNYLKGKPRSKPKPLSPFLFHKICATWKDVRPELPLVGNFYVHGKYMSLDDTELLEWLTRDLGPMSREISVDGVSIMPKEGWTGLADPTFSHSELANLEPPFHMLSRAFANSSSDAILLVSTCGTQERCLEAMAVEADCWLGEGKYSFTTLHENAVSLLKHAKRDAQASDIRRTIATSIYWCVVYISEAKKKDRIHHIDFKKARDNARGCFKTQGQESRSFWEHEIENVDRFSNRPEILSQNQAQDTDFSLCLLRPIIDQMMDVTAYLSKSLVAGGLLGEAELTDAFTRGTRDRTAREHHWFFEADPVKAANSYDRRSVEGGLRHLGPLFRTRLLPAHSAHHTVMSLPPIEDILKKSSIAASEIRRAYETSFQRTESRSNDCPLSTRASKQVGEGGIRKHKLDDVYLLAFDIIGSTDAQETGDFKDMINDHLAAWARRSSKNAACQAGDDKWVVLSQQLDEVWLLAFELLSIGREFEDNASGVRGTRKAIWHGRAMLEITKSNNTIIRDAEPPHEIPQLVGVLDAVDKATKKLQVPENWLVAVPERQRTEFSEVLPEDTAKTCVIETSAKHFDGPCVVFPVVAISDAPFGSQ